VRKIITLVDDRPHLIMAAMHVLAARVAIEIENGLWT
jgi:hypothetical protein